jgi:hypothetical protein
MYTLDAKQLALVIGGVLINGFADGEYINVEYNEDAFKFKSGSDGLGARAKTNNKSGTITINLMPNSPANAVLSGLYNLDDATSAGVVPFTITDLAAGDSFTGQGAWVKKAAGRSFQTEVTARQWVLESDAINQVSVPVPAITG